jgi:hypothetical protein
MAEEPFDVCAVCSVECTCRAPLFFFRGEYVCARCVDLHCLYSEVLPAGPSEPPGVLRRPAQELTP